MADPSTSSGTPSGAPSDGGAGKDEDWPDAQATARNGGGYPAPGYGRGYGRDFGAGGLGQGFDGSHGEGYGAGLETEAYRQGLAGPGFGAGEGPQQPGRSFAPQGEGFAGDHDGWSPGNDALDTIATSARRRGRFDCESPDGLLRDRVVSRLMADRLLDCSGIEVRVEDGTVTLAGWVRRPSDIALAELIAREAAAGCAEIRLALGVKAASAGRG